MWNHRRKMVDWVMRAVEMAVVFSAMSWALLWMMTHRRRSALSGRPSQRAQLEDASLGPLGPGHRLDSDDPDGAASLERSRRRRHID